MQVAKRLSEVALYARMNARDDTPRDGENVSVESVPQCWHCGEDLDEYPPEIGPVGEPWCRSCGCYYPQAEVGRA